MKHQLNVPFDFQKCLGNKNEHISFMSFSWKCFMLSMASLYEVIRKIETAFLCFKFSVISCTKQSAEREGERDTKQNTARLTMYNESPFIFYCTIWYEWILRATRQVFSVVIHHGNERQNAQWLIACLGKLWKWMKNYLKIRDVESFFQHRQNCFCTLRWNEAVVDGNLWSVSIIDDDKDGLQLRFQMNRRKFDSSHASLSSWKHENRWLLKP
jgi:hypothetical protein